MSLKTNQAAWVLAVVPLAAFGASAAFGADGLQAQAKLGGGEVPLFLTATNGTANFLAVVNTRTKQTDFIPTGGAGGAMATGAGWPFRGRWARLTTFGL